MSETGSPTMNPPQNPSSSSPSETNEAWSFDALDDDAKGYISKTGHKNLSSLIRDAQSTRSLLGADKASVVRIPKVGRAEDPGAWRDVDAALGVPGDGAYGEFKPSTGELQASEDQITAFDSAMAKAGATLAARNAALDAFHQINAQVRADFEAAQQEALAQASQELQRKWGVAYAEKEKSAGVALTGLDGEQEFGELLGKYGLDNHPVVTRLKAAIAELRAEAGPPPTGDPSTSGGAKLTPDQAKAKIAELEADEAFMKRYMGGDDAAIKHYLRLNEAATATS